MPTATLIERRVCLSPKDHRSFVTATRRLRNLMGRAAPSVVRLMEHNLSNRDAVGLAEDFLSSVGWPVELGQSRIAPRASAVRLLRPRASVRRVMPRPPADPRRN
jgi:hypothetical protein